MTHVVRLKGCSDNVTLRAYPDECHEEPYETIGRAQTNARDYCCTFTSHTKDNAPSPMENVVPYGNEGDVASQLDDDA